MIFTIIKQLRFKFFETINEKKIAIKIFHRESKAFGMLNLRELEVKKKIEELAPQKYLMSVFSEIIEGFLEILHFSLKPTKMNLKKAKPHTVRLGDIAVTHEAKMPKIKPLFFENLDDLLYFSHQFKIQIFKIMGCLWDNSVSQTQKIVMNLVERLQTIGHHSTTVAEQCLIIKALNKIIKRLEESNPETAKAIKKKIRVWLINIGTNSNKRALYSFYIERLEVPDIPENEMERTSPIKNDASSEKGYRSKSKKKKQSQDANKEKNRSSKNAYFDNNASDSDDEEEAREQQKFYMRIFNSSEGELNSDQA